jgi:3-methyl-2-oxobutanoate hydroxymethyltransferase
MNKVTTASLKERKEHGERITALTAYDFPMAKILDGAGVDLILVGDSAANVVHGYPNTLAIGMEEMLIHTRAVARAVSWALLVADMPFLSFQVSLEATIRNAGQFLKAGAEAVKLEGGEPVLKKVETLVKLGIPVLGHLGLTPQSIHRFGGYRLRGSSDLEAKEIRADAKSLEAAGCFGIVLEKVPSKLGRIITQELRIPVIGIGAGPDCDGQILVLYDLLGLYEEFKPRFVKRYLELAVLIREAVGRYITEVKEGKFPDREHSFE